MITVITHHNPNRNVDINRCVQSVNAALQHGDKHIFIECDAKIHTEFLQARFDSLKLGDYVCFVDDDDYIPENVLAIARQCIIENPDVGLYFTRECRVIGNDIIQCKAGENYENLISGPTSMHHLCVFNTKYITIECLDIAIKAQCGIEWVIKCWLALQYGAIHIPIDGYFYCLHKHQLSGKMARKFFDNRSFFKGVFAGWQKYYGQIPIYTLPEY